MADSKKNPRKSGTHKRPAAKGKPAPKLSDPAAGKSKPVVVGVGASAGGMEAFSQLLRALPEDPGLALVFVQHLAPHHESALATLLASSTHLPVIQPVEDSRLEPDHVYVIPPNKGLEVQDGRLIIQPRPTDRTQYLPIDHFFKSLAKACGSDAIGVILSGTGSDGVEGIHAIKAAGGTALAQDPTTAKQPGMPQAVISTGKIDYALAPAELAQELARLARERSEAARGPRRSEMPALDPEQLEEVFAMLRTNSGVDFGQYKQPTVQRRIQRRMALHKLGDLAGYVGLLRENAAEVSSLYQDILIHVTRFFREPDSFKSLAKETIPAILAARKGDDPLRIWVPACSTGEEPYSVAMTLIEHLDERHENIPIQIFATDLSETAIEQARAGVYPPNVVEDLSRERLRRFFTQTDGQYRINKSIRDLCVFARQDLTRDPPFSKIDLIVCRNVLIYLGQPLQNRLIGVFHYALKPTGFLMLGSAETIGAQSELFAVSDKKHRIYRKKFLETPQEVKFTVPYSRPTYGRAARGGEEVRSGGNVQNEANRLVLDRYAPPGVVVNDELRIIQFRGQTGRFLEPAPGDASLNLLKMCREGLLHGLRTALQAAKKKDAPVRREGLRVKTNGDTVSVTVEVVPLSPTAEGRHYLILFQDIAHSVAPPLRIASGSKKGAGNNDEEVERLQKELVANREYLQSIIQDLEAANEELQSANEEVLSSNEELQSTNEELDTAKEELESTNEELNTVNEELHGRNDELARINSDLVNLLNGVQIAIVIVASDLRIRRFTSMAERILNVIPGDVGRPISQINLNIKCPDLDKLILEVIDTVSVQQREVRDAEGRTLSLTIRPYKNADNRIDGAVLTLFDVDEIRRHERQAQEAREFAEAVLNTVREPLVVLDGELRVRTANPAFCRLFGVTLEQIQGNLLHELGSGEWNIPRLRGLLHEVVPSNSNFESFEIRQEFGGVGTKQIRLNARRISGSDHRPHLILLAMEEVPSSERPTG